MSHSVFLIWSLITLQPGQHGWHVADNIFECILLKEDDCVKNSMEIIPKGSVERSTLVYVMAWCCQATSHYNNQCWSKCLTLPQWVIIAHTYVYMYFQGVQWSGKSQGNSRLGKSQGKVREFCWRSWKKMNIGKSQGKVREFAFSAI